MTELDLVVSIAQALLELEALSSDEFERVAKKHGWTVSTPVHGLWETGDRYPVVLDRIAAPPIVLCPFLGTEELPQAERRESLRLAYVEARALAVNVLGAPSVEQNPADAMVFSIWASHRVLVSIEEADYEGDEPFLVLAAVEAGSAAAKERLTARISQARGASRILVEHFGGKVEVRDWSSLSATLDVRFSRQANEFWLSGAERYPSLAILMRGGVACVHYFPRDGHPGFISVSDGVSGEVTVFRTNTDSEDVEVPNEHVVSASGAREAAKKFLSSTDLPSPLKWKEL